MKQTRIDGWLDSDFNGISDYLQQLFSEQKTIIFMNKKFNFLSVIIMNKASNLVFVCFQSICEVTCSALTTTSDLPVPSSLVQPGTSRQIILLFLNCLDYIFKSVTLPIMKILISVGSILFTQLVHNVKNIFLVHSKLLK